MKPYAIISDTHNHGWSAFSTVNEHGINSRLAAILHEFGRVADTVRDAGGDTIYHAGDLFHVRGSVAPSVLNPTRSFMESLSSVHGVKWKVLPGNHDMELKEASVIGDSVQAVAGPKIDVIHSPMMFDGVLMVPWIADLAKLQEILLSPVDDRANVDLIIHAPVDGVIKGIPDHGLDPNWLRGLGFKRVFAGHYHNHVDFGGGVYSIGAIAHHTWSDVGSKAGFLIVHDDRVDFHASHAPQFVDIDGEMDDATIKCLVDGNFVRARVDSSAKGRNVNELRDWLIKLGAKGVSIMSVKAPTHARAATSTIKAGSSLEVSVAEYIAGRTFADAPQVITRCQKILSEAAVL